VVDSEGQDSKDDLEIQLPISRDDLDRLQALQTVACIPDLSDFFNEALRVFEWVVEQKGSGKEVGAASEKRFLQEILLVPSLERGSSRER
jgi:hypothetical protein